MKKIIENSDEQERVRLGEKLRQAREYLNLLQDAVALKIGIPRTALSHIESGQRRIDALELKKLADLYGQSVSFFTESPQKSVGLPPDVAYLARAAQNLSAKDREELGRFADYLRARAKTSARKE